MDPSNGANRSSHPSPGSDKDFGFSALKVIEQANSLEADAVNSTGSLIDETKADLTAGAYVAARQRQISKGRLLKFGALGAAILIALVCIFLLRPTQKTANNASTDASKLYPNTSIPLAELNSESQPTVLNNQVLSINGQLNVNNALVLTPGKQPTAADSVAGQLYFDQTSNKLSYFDGKAFQSIVANQSGTVATGMSMNGSTGDITTGTGVALAGNTLSNTGVLSLQGQSGNVTLTGGPGLVVNGTTLSNSGLLSLGGATGSITLGSNLTLVGNTLNAAGSNINSLTGTGNIAVTDDGSGNFTITTTGQPGMGSVTSSGGSTGRIALFTGVQNIEDSLIGQTGSVITINGDLTVTGTATLNTPLAVTSGGTGSNNASGARVNLGAAARGANSDITSITGLTTALTVAQGGTGVGTLATNGVVLGNGTSPLTSVVAGASGLCLVSTGGAPSFQACPGSGGVVSVNGLTGTLTVANASASGSTITLNDASTSVKGLASFNATNFLVSSGAVNTVQNISVTASPTFAGLTLSNALSAGSGGTGRNSLTSNSVLLGNGTSAINMVTGTNGQCLVIVSGVPTFQACPGSGGVTSVNTETGAVTIQGTTGTSVSTSGGTVTINDASGSVKGLASFNATNFLVSSGAVNTVQNISVTSTPTFGGLNLTTALAVTSGGTGATSLSTGGVVIGNGTSAVTTATGTNGQCLVISGTTPNFQTCPGSGGVTSVNSQTGAVTIQGVAGSSVSTSAGVVTINDASGSVKGLASFNTTNLTVTGGAVNTIQDISATSAPTFAGLTLTSPLAVSSGGTGRSTLTANGVLLGNGTSGINVATGTNGQCLVIVSGVPTFQACPGSGGVVSVNSQTGAVTIQGVAGSSVSTSAGVVTINDASGSVKGLASFNGTNFSIVNGAVNTVQDITTTSAPQFGQLTVVSNQATGKMLTINNSNASATGNLLDLQLNGTSQLTVAPNGSLTTNGTLNGQTISSSANFTGSLTVAGTLNVNTITPTSALTVGVGGQSFTIQGNVSSTLRATNGSNTTTVGFQSPTANVTYNFAAAAAGSYDICTTAGNCTGVGGGVTTAGGTTDRLAKFTSGSAIADSIISDNGSTVTIGGNLSVNTITPTGALTVGSTSQNLTMQGAAVTLSANNGGFTNSLVFNTPSGSNKTISLPNASGTVAVSASGPLVLDANGNLTCPTCITGGGGGSGSGVLSLNGLDGDLTLQGTDAASLTNSGATITINDASSTVKGLARFNSTNLVVASGSVNTIQDITVTSTPTFGGLNLTAALTVGNGGTGATTASGARSNLGAAASGANSDITSLSGLTTALSVAQGGTGITTTPTNGQILIGNGSGFSLNTLTAGSGITITNASGAITIAAPTAGTCPACATTSLDNLAGVAINTSLLPGTAGGANLGSSTLPFGQLSLSGTSANPATNNFLITGVSTSGTRTIALPDASGTVAVSASGNIALNAAGNISFTGTLSVADGGTGATTASGARSNLGAAASGANSDITSLSGLTTALSVSQGGTGLSGLTANQLLYASGTSTISQLSNGSAGQCLVSNGTGSVPTFQTCTGAGGVASLNGLTGSVTVANATGSAGTVTIDNAAADGTTKGIATFNSTNFTASSGVINTIQGIATTSTPTFGGLNLTAALTVGNGGTGATTASGARSNLGAAASGANSDITSLSGLTTALSVSQGGTGANTFAANSVLLGNGTSAIATASGTDGQCLVIVSGVPTFQSCPGTGGVTSVNSQTGTLTIQGTSAGSLTTTTGTITINDASSSVKGLASFNSTNFSVSSGAVNTVQNIATTSAPTFGQLTLSNTGSLTLGTSGTAAGSTRFYDGSTAFTSTLNTTALTANRTIALPNESGTICLQNSANCGFLTGSAANGSYIQLQPTTPGTAQTGHFNISGTGIAGTLQGTTVYGNTFDRATSGTLNVANANTTTLNIATNNANHTVNIATGTGVQNVTIGSTDSTSLTTIQGGNSGILFKQGNHASGGYTFQVNGNTILTMDYYGRATFKATTTGIGSMFAIQNSSSNNLFYIDSTSEKTFVLGDGLYVNQGGITNDGALVFTGTAVGTYVTPLGANLSTKIQLPNVALSGYNQLIALGLPSGAASTARGITVLDARTGAHQPTIAVLSPDENQIGGFSWDGSNTDFGVKTSSSTIAFINNGGTGITIKNQGGTGNDQITEFGKASANTGQASFMNNINSNYVILKSGTTSSSYQFVLPTAMGSTGQCLSIASTSGNEQRLGYGTCGGGGTSVQLQASTPGTPQTGHLNISGTGIFGAGVNAGTLSVSGAGTITTTNSSAFLVQNASNAAIVTVSTSGLSSGITIGTITNGATININGGYTAYGSARKTKTLLLTAEYAGATLDASSDASCSGAYNGTMTSGYTGDTSPRQTYYNWASGTASTNCYNVIVQVPLPSDWDGWAGSPFLNAYNSAGTNSTSIYVKAIGTNNTTDTNYAGYVAVSSGTSFAASSLTLLDSTNYSAGGYMTFKIRMSSPNTSTNVRIGNLTLQYYSKY